MDSADLGRQVGKILQAGLCENENIFMKHQWQISVNKSGLTMVFFQNDMICFNFHNTDVQMLVV